MKAWTKVRLAAALACLLAALSAATTRPVRAGEEPAEKRERCATRLAIALQGRSPDATLIAATDPQAQVGTLVGSAAFVERFARFANSQLNGGPGNDLDEDVVYTLAKHVLQNGLPWRELFVGSYAVAGTKVTPDSAGLGYFRGDAWMKRYAGNEQDGYRLVAAYQMLQNTTGLRLTAVSNAADADTSAAGRQAGSCAGCHYNGWFALDRIAKVLSRRKGQGAAMTFLPPSEGPQAVLDGTVASNDRDVVMALVASENFRFNTCRLAFQFLYGRAENTCEAEVFERCADAFAKEQTMQSAIVAVATHPTFCQ